MNVKCANCGEEYDLTNKKIPNKASKIRLKVPVITFVVYKTPIITAIMTRIILSRVLIFFFMTIIFRFSIN